MTLDDAAVRRLLRLEELLPAVRRALVDLSAGRVVQPLRLVMDIPAEQGLLFLKPALAGNTLATKLITLMPRNAERGLPTLLATIVLTDPVSGRTVAVMDGTWITELRTAAASAVAADALTPPGPKIVAMLGSGALARSHALTLRAIKELEFDRAMGKVSPKDFDEMVGRLRARAISLMKELDEGEAGYRMLIERELAARLTHRTGVVPTSRAVAPVVVSNDCANCGTSNDADAAFCKRCGTKIERLETESHATR